MKNFKTEQAMLDYIGSQINFEPNISIILDEPYMEYILDEKKDFETISFTKEKNSDCYTYLINKIEDENGDIHLFVKPVEFNDDGILETEIENDIIILQEGLFDGEDIENIVDYDELIIVDYGEEEDESEESEYEEDLVTDEYLEEKISDFIDVLQSNEDNSDFCFHCALKSLLEEVFCSGFEDGRNSLAINIGDLMDKIVNGDDED